MNNIEKIKSIVRKILQSTTKEQLKANLLEWKKSCSENLFYIDGNKYEYVYMPTLFQNASREDAYNTVLRIIEELSDEKVYSVAIPSGNCMYRTLVRNSSGSLEISDKRYQSLSLLKKHNSMVPGGITVDELHNSSLSWCMQFMEELND